MNGLLGSVLPLYLVAANVVTFLLYGLDKARARRGAWRISERTLLTAAFAGGCAGALLGDAAVPPQDAAQNLPNSGAPCLRPLGRDPGAASVADAGGRMTLNTAAAPQRTPLFCFYRVFLPGGRMQV